jgi:transcriptional regulator with XRE-family HTH domain
MKSKTQDMATTTLRDFIRRRRGGMGLSQRALGQLIGVTGELICFVEAGQRRLNLDRMPDLASALGCDPKKLCRLALQEAAPALYAELFAATVPLAVGGIAEYGDTAAEFRAGSGTFMIDPNGHPSDFE